MPGGDNRLQDQGCYLPSEAEIAAECARIRAGWTPEDFKFRHCTHDETRGRIEGRAATEAAKAAAREQGQRALNERLQTMRAINEAEPCQSDQPTDRTGQRDQHDEQQDHRDQPADKPALVWRKLAEVRANHKSQLRRFGPDFARVAAEAFHAQLTTAAAELEAGAEAVAGVIYRPRANDVTLAEAVQPTITASAWAAASDELASVELPERLITGIGFAVQFNFAGRLGSLNDALLGAVDSVLRRGRNENRRTLAGMLRASAWDIARQLGQRFASVETGRALNLARWLAIEQKAIDCGEPIGKAWVSGCRDTVRLSHAKLNGSTIGIGERFQVERGSCLYPQDADLPQAHLTGCGCTITAGRG